MSNSSSPAMPPFSNTPSLAEYKALARQLLSYFNVPRDLVSIRAMAPPPSSDKPFSLQHDDLPPITTPEQYVEMFKGLAEGPFKDFNYEVNDMCAEYVYDGQGSVTGAKVWTLGTITGLPEGVTKESVDLLRFDGQGYFVYNKDVQREVNEA